MFCAMKRCGCRGLVGVAALMCWLLASSSSWAEWTVGTRLPDLATQGLEGTVPALEGKVVLVDFWASWCAPCKKSFPALDAISRDYASRGVVVLAISVDETAADMQEFLTKHPVAFASVRDARQRLVEAAGVEAMPSSFLVDGRGIIRHVHRGFHGADTEQQYRREIDALLATGGD